MSAAKKINSTQSIGELLVQNDLISRKQLLDVQKLGRKNKQQMIEVMIHSGLIDESELSQFMSEHYQCQIINLEDFEISPALIKKVPKKICEKFMVIPISQIEDTYVFACIDPSDKFAKEEIMLAVGSKVEFVIASSSSIKEAIAIHYQHEEKDMRKIFSQFETSSSLNPVEEEDNPIQLDSNADEPVVQFVNQLLLNAQLKQASDIHIENYETKCRIRFRIDGKLHEMYHPPSNINPFIVARIKVMSRMDISEKRKPQDGRLSVILGNGNKINFRVNTTPTVSGEKVVMRLLDDVATSIDLKFLGMSEEESQTFKKALHRPQGLVLITGPTGSGKTTTIYSGLKILNTPDRNISTAEDPVEYKVEGLNQVQIHPKIGLTFSSALRSFLRQDPDVMLVGEIRDTETSEVAFKAASTGHLVVSTLHTNDTTSTITRLLDMGIPDYSIAENTNLVVGQRLLRKICIKCAAPDLISRDSLKALEMTDEQIEKGEGRIMKGAGCRHCLNVGNKGRIAVYEMLTVTDEIKKGIFNKISSMQMKRSALAKGELVTVRQRGIQKLIEGIVSYEEVLYGTMPDFND